MRRSFFPVLSLALFCLTALMSSQAAAGIKQEGALYVVDDATGYAPINDGKKNEAREEAKREAYRDALEKALGATVTGVTEMENYAVVRDKVFSQTTGIVKNMDIVREWEDDGLLYVEAICKVSVAALDGVLGPAVLDAIGHPRVMVLIDERVRVKDADTSPFISSTETETLKVFEKAGYLIVDPDQMRALLNVDPSSAFDDPSKIMDFARTQKADVVILGRSHAATFTPGGVKVSGVTLYGVKGTVQLKAVLTKTAYQITSQTIEAETGKKPAQTVESGAERCFKEAAAKASGAIVNKIAYALVSGPAGVPGGTVNVKIANISFAEVELVEEALREFIGKSGSVYERAFGGNALELDVVSEKTARNLASFMSERGVNITDVTSQTVSGAMGTAGEPSAPPGAVSVRIAGVGSFKEAEFIANAVREFIGSTGTVTDKFMDNTLLMEIVSDKTARDIASHLSKMKINIDGVGPAEISGKPQNSKL